MATLEVLSLRKEKFGRIWWRLATSSSVAWWLTGGVEVAADVEGLSEWTVTTTLVEGETWREMVGRGGTTEIGRGSVGRGGRGGPPRRGVEEVKCGRRDVGGMDVREGGLV